MNAAIFREYDIRGKFPDDLNNETAYELGKSFGTYFQSKGAGKISVGHDCRESYPVLKDALIKGLVENKFQMISPIHRLFHYSNHLEIFREYHILCR